MAAMAETALPDTAVSVDQTAQVAPTLPGFDAAPAIAAGEHALLDFLSTPTEQILGGLPLQRFPEQPPNGAPPDPQPPEDPLGGGMPFDPFQLIGPVVGVLGTLGSGLFSGIDPTQVFRGVSETFDGVRPSLQRARGAVAHDFQGQSGEAADAKTQTAVAKGAEVATQADGVRGNLSTAASDVAQARKRVIDVVDDFQAKLAAIGPQISTPAGRAAVVAAAKQAHDDSNTLMKDLRSRLRAHTAELAAIGAPVEVKAEKKPPMAKATKNRPKVAKIPVSKVQYKPKGFAGGRDAYKRYIAETLDVMGITDPKARSNWTRGLLVGAQRESSFNPAAVNKWDSNAHGARRSDGAPANSSRGGLQTIPSTFAAHHQAGTSTNIYDPVANTAAAMNYLMARYDVNRDGSNLDKVNQFNPNAQPLGY